MAPADEETSLADESAMAPSDRPAVDQTAPEDSVPETETAMAPSAELGASPAPVAPDAATSEPDQTAMAPEEQPEDTAAAADQSPAANLSEVESGSVSAEQLLGATVYSSDEQSIGEVGDVRLAADGGEVDAMIVDVGGFLGIGEKPVAIGFDNLTIRQDESGAFYVYTDFTREELESAPDYDEASYDEERDTMRLTMVR
jgi:sporulation protein YlmC with PRC-barrel domain